VHIPWRDKMATAKVSYDAEQSPKGAAAANVQAL
jgi:cold shock CspA family protein